MQRCRPLTKVEFLPLANFLEVHREYMKLGNQMENTCGPYTLAYILRALGYREHNGVEVTEEYLAYLARTRIAPEERRAREEAMVKLLYGEEDPSSIVKKHGKILYRYELLVTDKPSELGTSAAGVKYALEAVTRGDLVGVPVPSRRGERVFFTQEAFKKLVMLLIDKIYEWRYQAILNLQTGMLLNSIGIYHDVFEIIFSQNPELSVGPNPWRVGHFVSLAGFIRIVDTSGEKIFFLIRDTYKSAGFRGYHVQPLENVRRALVRDDGREGGILLIVAKNIAPEVEAAVKNLGLEVGLWDNGTPF